MGTSGSRSTFGSVFWILWHMSSTPTPTCPSVLWLSMGWSVLVSVSRFFYVPHPATCSKMNSCFHNCGTFCPTLGILLAGCTCAAFAAYFTWATLCLVAITIPVFEGTYFINNHCCCHNSSIWLVLVEVFHSHFVLLGMLEEGCICDVLCLLFFNLTHFLTSKCFIAWNSNSVLHVPFSLLQFGTGITWLSPWYIDQAGQLTHVHPVWCCCISHQYGSSKMLTLRACQWRPWKLHQGFFLFSSCLEIRRLFHCLKPCLPRKPTIVAYHHSLSMLDASRANVIWPFHSSNASWWSSTCQSNVGGWNISCSVAIVVQID